MIHFWIVSSAQKIIHRNIKVISEKNKSGIVRLPFLGFVSANRILVHIELHSQPNLRNMFLLSKLFQSKNKYHP